MGSYTHTKPHTYIHTPIHTRPHTYIHIYIKIHTYTYTYPYTNIHTITHTHKTNYTHTHSHIHTKPKNTPYKTMQSIHIPSNPQKMNYVTQNYLFRLTTTFLLFVQKLSYVWIRVVLGVPYLIFSLFF